MGMAARRRGSGARGIGDVLPAPGDPGSDPQAPESGSEKGPPSPERERVPIPPPPPLPDQALRNHLRRLEQAKRPREAPGPRWRTVGIPVAAILVALASLYWSATLRDRLIVQESALTELTRQNQQLQEQLRESMLDLQSRPSSEFPSSAEPPADMRPGLKNSRQAAAMSAAIQPGAAAGQGSSTSSRAGGVRTGTPGRGTLSGEEGGRGNLEPQQLGAQARGSGVRTSGGGVVEAGRPQPATVLTKSFYPDPVAKNIADVFAMQQHSPVKLTEFHTAQGAVAWPLPELGLEIRNPDQKRGTYTLITRSGNSRVEQQGRIYVPLPIMARAGGREYQLTVLNIANDQVFGYLAPR